MASLKKKYYHKKMPVAKGATLNHIARETSDIRRLANFYQEIFGFEEIESPDLVEFKIVWLNLPGSFTLHLIQKSSPLESPCGATSPVVDSSKISIADHICFTVPNFESFEQTLKEKGIQVFPFQTQTNDKVKRMFLFDPDGNMLEVVNE